MLNLCAGSSISCLQQHFGCDSSNVSPQKCSTSCSGKEKCQIFYYATAVPAWRTSMTPVSNLKSSVLRRFLCRFCCLLAGELGCKDAKTFRDRNRLISTRVLAVHMMRSKMTAVLFTSIPFSLFGLLDGESCVLGATCSVNAVNGQSLPTTALSLSYSLHLSLKIAQ